MQRKKIKITFTFSPLLKMFRPGGSWRGFIWTSISGCSTCLCSGKIFAYHAYLLICLHYDLEKCSTWKFSYSYALAHCSCWASSGNGLFKPYLHHFKPFAHISIFQFIIRKRPLSYFAQMQLTVSVVSPIL